ncbi:MAG: aminoacyl-tRNA hydrolase [Pirellula sp.]|nr:aminoacyl-tRNA hydrolase [Pirellula sp.]
MALIVGLGNPGAKYDRTRHNIGFDCLNRLHASMGSPSLQAKFEGQFAKGRIGQRDVCLVWPLTFMNCSGRCVSQFARFYKVELENILVICDDLSLPLGKLRIRKSGSSGGQKGLNDIIQSLGTQDVTRLRIGIDPTPAHWDTADYVLSKFSASERAVVDEGLFRANEAIAIWLKEGVDSAMNIFNR